MNDIIFITGMAGAGKSTICNLLAKQLQKCLYIQVDELREKMVAGYARPSDGKFQAEAIQQFQMARTTTAFMANLYTTQDINVIIDDICVPDNFTEQYSSLFKLPNVHRILLYPKASTVIERIKQRGGPMEHIQFVPIIYEFLDKMPKDDWIVLDSSEWSIQKTVSEILSNISSSRDQMPA